MLKDIKELRNLENTKEQRKNRDQTQKMEKDTIFYGNNENYYITVVFYCTKTRGNYGYQYLLMLKIEEKTNKNNIIITTDKTNGCGYNKKSYLMTKINKIIKKEIKKDEEEYIEKIEDIFELFGIKEYLKF